MSLLGEQVVEEWLNRNGYFTIRGIKVGVGEIDILAIRPLPDGHHECRHVEVQVSINPISYITKVPAAIRKKTGIGAHNAKKRDTKQLKQGVDEWVDAKFNEPRKVELRNRLCSGSWTRETRDRNGETRRGDSTLKESWRHNPSSKGRSLGNDEEAWRCEGSGRC